MRFGFDFDNTLVNYDIASRIWSKQNNIEHIFTLQDLKEFYRLRRDYQEDWKVVQEWLYTEGLNHASVNVGAWNLIEKLGSQNAELFIVSHKTPESAAKKVDLIQPARKWIEENLSNVPELGANRIYFEATRKSKVKRIASLGLTHFVDDLLEVFQEENYPKNIKSFWLSVDAKNSLSDKITVVNTLDSIINYV